MRCAACRARGGARSRALRCVSSVIARSWIRNGPSRPPVSWIPLQTSVFGRPLPFEPIDQLPRLQMLRLERAAERAAFADGRRPLAWTKRRQGAEITRRVTRSSGSRRASEARGVTLAAIHAAELQLPEAWLPFVVSR